MSSYGTCLTQAHITYIRQFAKHLNAGDVIGCGETINEAFKVLKRGRWTPFYFYLRDVHNRYDFWEGWTQIAEYMAMMNYECIPDVFGRNPRVIFEDDEVIIYE